MRGQCLCRQLSFESAGKTPLLYQCHCSLCRKLGLIIRWAQGVPAYMIQVPVSLGVVGSPVVSASKRRRIIQFDVFLRRQA